MRILWWIGTDRISEFSMGDYATDEEAVAAIPDAKAELIQQCGDDEGWKRTILDGRWLVVTPSEVITYDSAND